MLCYKLHIQNCSLSKWWLLNDECDARGWMVSTITVILALFLSFCTVDLEAWKNAPRETTLGLFRRQKILDFPPIFLMLNRGCVVERVPMDRMFTIVNDAQINLKHLFNVLASP